MPPAVAASHTENLQFREIYNTDSPLPRIPWTIGSRRNLPDDNEATQLGLAAEAWYVARNLNEPPAGHVKLTPPFRLATFLVCIGAASACAVPLAQAPVQAQTHPLKDVTIVKTRFCIVPDPILADGTADDVAAVLRPDDPELPLVLGRTGIASTPVFETNLSWEALLETGRPSDAKKTGDRVKAAPGYVVEEEADPF